MSRKTRRTRRPNVGPAPVRNAGPIGACPDGMCRPDWAELGDGSFIRRDLPTLDQVENFWRPKGGRS